MREADPIALVHELAGRRCRCGKTKRAGQTFCGACYASLAPPLRSSLYRLIGDGYEEAYEAATAALGPVPPDPPRPGERR